MESSNLQRGIQLFELGRYEDAISYLVKDIESNIGKYYLSLCYYNTEQYDRAENTLNILLTETPNDADVMHLKSRVLIQKEAYKKAMEWIDQAIAINPYESTFFGVKGSILLNDKKYEDALTTVNEGLRIDPKNVYCLNLRAQLLTKLNRNDEAENTIEHLLYDNPNDSHSHANVGWVALQNGNTKKALDHFKQALQLNPNDDYARSGMSTALKTKNFIYKWYLKYSFWMTKKSEKNQWVFIIGIYLAYRFGIKLLAASGFGFLIIPVVIAYLVFAMGGWIMESMSNAILNFDAYGKYLLSDDEKNSGYTFTALTALGIVSSIAYFAFKEDYYLLLTATFFCTLVPLPRAFIQHSKKAKIFGIGYGILMLLIGNIGFLVVPNLVTLGSAVFIMLIAFTWAGNLVK